MDDATSSAHGGPSDEEKDLLEFGIELAFRAAGPVVAKSEPEPAEIEG